MRHTTKVRRLAILAAVLLAILALLPATLPARAQGGGYDVTFNFATDEQAWRAFNDGIADQATYTAHTGWSQICHDYGVGAYTQEQAAITFDLPA